VLGHGTPMDVRLRQDEDRGNQLWLPSPGPAQDGRHDSSLHVECSNRLLQVDQFGLDLNDQERVQISAPGKNVDRPSIPEMIE
jgi:hypothetical protein